MVWSELWTWPSMVSPVVRTSATFAPHRSDGSLKSIGFGFLVAGALDTWAAMAAASAEALEICRRMKGCGGRAEVAVRSPTSEAPCYS